MVKHPHTTNRQAPSLLSKGPSLEDRRGSIPTIVENFKVAPEETLRTTTSEESARVQEIYAIENAHHSIDC